VSDRWPIMNKNWSAPAELERRKRVRLSLRRRIERRARELGMIERQRCFNAMVAELYLGRINEDDVDAWEPVRGTSPALEHVHAAIARRQDRHG